MLIIMIFMIVMIITIIIIKMIMIIVTIIIIIFVIVMDCYMIIIAIIITMIIDNYNCHKDEVYKKLEYTNHCKKNIFAGIDIEKKDEGEKSITDLDYFEENVYAFTTICAANKLQIPKIKTETITLVTTRQPESNRVVSSSGVTSFSSTEAASRSAPSQGLKLGCSGFKILI